jgi:Zn-dependent protease with chaperone function
MIAIKGYWFDGRTSSRVEALCEVYDSGAVTIRPIQNGAPLYRSSQFKAQISPRLASIPRHLTFENDATFETDDLDGVARLEKRMAASSRPTLAERIGSRKRNIALCILILIGMLFCAWRYGIPAAAKFIAAKLPPSIYQFAEEHTLTIIDKTILKPSQLDPAVQKRIQNRFAPLVEPYSDPPITILFRQGGPKIDANAFALPHGTIIFTDEMVNLAQHDEELTAILAHEIGHIVNRHVMRTMIQDSLLAFTLLAISGDASGTSEILLGLPVILTELAYSREFEHEADGYALAFLQSKHISPRHFANLLSRIKTKLESEKKDSGPGVLRYFSTHPDIDARIKRFQLD